jgi:hypothetical protein
VRITFCDGPRSTKAASGSRPTFTHSSPSVHCSWVLRNRSAPRFPASAWAWMRFCFRQKEWLCRARWARVRGCIHRFRWTSISSRLHKCVTSLAVTRRVPCRSCSPKAAAKNRMSFGVSSTRYIFDLNPREREREREREAKRR